ncbi:hypothetical protein ACIA5C_16780 [Actinoplanes sp. NPDC051343]|uniref:hypothetical protein n=1 Tax=Actinoplanes sp. NPDC051343 TaxID=3363906 RepID=UPI0037A0E7BA
MIRDRDDRYPALFDPVLADAGVDVVPTGVRIPRMNAISGTPTVAGTFQAAITGHDANPANPAGTYSFTWVINAPTTSTVPNVIDDGPTTAASEPADAGLSVGSQSQTVDCDHLNTVPRRARRRVRRWPAARR